jgi:hypothetical protein
MADINKFLSAINKYSDFQRQSRFQVRFPQGIPGSLSSDSQLEYKCESVEIPGRSLNTFEHRTYGPVVKYPVQSFFSEITCMFFCTGNISKQPLTGMVEKRVFEDWMNWINTYPVTASQNPAIPYHNFKYKTEYAKEIIIECFDVNQGRSYSIYIVNAYPVSVSPVTMSWTSEEIARVAVSFSYDYFYYSKEYTPYGSKSTSISTQQPRTAQEKFETGTGRREPR